MLIDLNPQIINALESEFDIKHSQSGIHLREGRCPACGKKSVWTFVENPFFIRCDHQSKCGWESTAKEWFPDLYVNLNKKYPVTAKNPMATAEAYLSLMRGFDPELISGWYEQDKYWNPHGDKGTATVRFYLNTEKTVFWEKFIDPVKVKDEKGQTKTMVNRAIGPRTGLWWQPPILEINEKDHVYLCEGVFDAIALNLNGLKAVAVMTSGAFPEKAIQAHRGKKITWVIALDNDTAGRKGAEKLAYRLRDIGERVAGFLSSESESKLDWNDLHKNRRPNKNPDQAVNYLSKEDIKHYKYFGSLQLAKSYSEKAMLMHAETDNPYFIFHFKNNTYSFRYDESKYRVALVEAENRGMGTDEENHDFAWGAASKLKNIATFSRRFLYFQQPDSGEEGQFFFNFGFANGAHAVQIALPGRTLTTAGEYTKSTFNLNPSAIYDGSSKDLLYENKEEMKTIPKIVKTLDYIGYDRVTNAYIYHDYAVENGRVIEVNKESFFQLRKSGIKTMVEMKQELNTELNTDWLADYKVAYGAGGMVALTCWFGGLFAEQMREHHRSFPFVSIIGEAGSGKSDLISFLWKIIGREAESFNPAIGSVAGRIRNMSQYANLPLIFNEVDNEQISRDSKTKRFDWNEYKDLYEGQFGRFTGKKTQGNEVRKPKFKGYLFITQNIPVTASEAIMSRIIHLQFDRTHHSEAGKHASDRLLGLPIKEVSGFLLHANKMSKAILSLFDQQYPLHAAAIRAKGCVKLERIIHNHAQMMAFADCLALILPLSKADIDEIQSTFIAMSGERQLSLNADNPLVARFWDTFDYIDGGTDQAGERASLANHARYPDDEIWVNIPDFMRRCDNAGQPRIDEAELQRHLKGSHLYKFVETKVAYSRLDKRTMRMWVFKR